MKTKDLYTEIFSFTFKGFYGKLVDMETQIAIYALIDPRTKLPFYVGKTNNPKIRLKYHRRANGITPTAKFIREMKSEGHRPDMQILELCSDSDWQEREGYWVELYQSTFGVDQILNVMEGGKQAGRFLKHTEATKERLRLMFKGRPIPPEQRARISLSLTGKVQDPETIEKRMEKWSNRRIEEGLSPLNRFGSWEEYRAHGREQYKEYRRKRRRENGALVKGSEEWKRHLSEKTKAQFAAMTPEEKEARYAPFRGKLGANKGRKFGALSAEQRAKLSEIHKKRLASLTPEQREARMAAARAARMTR